MKLKDLHNGKKTAFKVPKDYFNTNLEESILSEAKLRAKVLNHGFKAPDNYFETLEEQIYSKTDRNPKAKVKTIQLKPWIYAASIAASLALIFTLTFSNNQSNSISAINNDSLESFILDEDLNTSEMATLITDSDLFGRDILNNALSDATIDYYIESEIDDLEDLFDN
ncbi:hypothetical protein BN863_8500 [Formosa agariphila KMM 3901]|uniref:Uncharacterized protein n=1 Tax=Formosa agariphila (strain DSM 15362 / KCTC 12365 / LMG 23005 / KMM 3901 / M-2Alg 35-1) TaxID=1347342 RepID=T2KI68_FORAG|nr:hypothetical protein [Formosa agariphila]CDF78562.1 hypothetical protein BN863_8500 [Formosa agariphila KMM 3901]